jgi:tetratricopeptide (TPR) repeat protein
VQTGWLRFSNDNDVARGRGLVERGLRVADALAPGGDIGLLARSYLARMDLLDGRLGEALAWTAELAERATAKADRMSLALARYNESWVHCEAGRTAEARRATDDALTLAAAQPGDLLAGITQSALARVLYFEGNADGALQVAARAEKLSGRSGQVGFQSHALVVAGYAHLLLGEATSAQRCFERLVPLGARWPSTLLHRARGALEVGDFATAEELARRALDAPRAIRARALAVRGLALGLSGGRKEEAETALAEAINLCDALGLRPSLAEAQTFQAELCRRLGDRARASYYAARAGELYTSCGMPEHAKQAQLLLR